MDDSIKNVIKTSAIGYFLIILSILLILIFGGFGAEYPLSFGIFTMELVSFRLIEIHKVLVIAPFLVASLSLALLSKTSMNRGIAAGISLNAYYLLSAFLFYIKGAGEVPYEILLIWVPSVFVIGYVSSVLSDKI
jgi:hypothetical protein